MTNYVFIDTVMQVFESDGNLHIIGGLANGEVDAKGKDILEKTLHLTMPMAKAQKILPEIAASLPKILQSDAENSVTENQAASIDKNEFEGSGLHFKL